jgi:hypothetical protein
MKVSLLLLPALAISLARTTPAAAAKPVKHEPLVKQVADAIQLGVKYLRGKQLADGSWEIDDFSKVRPGGWTCLAMLALLNAGVPPDDKMIQKGLDYLRQQQPTFTYVRALQTMVYAEAGKTEDGERIQRNADWLIAAAIENGGDLLGWTYTGGSRQAPDNSNTQYALLGLHAARTAGAKIPDAMWHKIRAFYLRTQTPEGGWVYARHHNNRSYLTMDTAGLCGLLIAGMELNSGREKLVFPRQGSVHANNCGNYQENGPIQRALAWISGPRFDIELSDKVYYNLYGIERAGRLSGQRFLGSHDWYREGCKFLVREQDKKEGCWPGRGVQFDKWPLINTSFALLFLSKGQTPVLISKMAHGPGQDWNNDRNDAKHLTEFCSRELFKRQPLAWQVFDAGKVDVTNKEELLELTGELLQTPIVYFNGHRAPAFTDKEKDLLKEYIENGGFILAEACCGKKAFDAGFQELVKELFPDNDLEDLEAGHPVWTAFFKVEPGSFPLKGIKRGCKTVLIYSPHDLSCLWESNNFKNPRVVQGFRLGANIVAYATGLELPKVKGTEQAVLKPLNDNKKVPRNYLKVGQLKHGSDWQPAPNAMRILLEFMETEAGINVDKKKEAIEVDHKDVINFKFLYMHGSKGFSFKEEQLDKLRFNLTTGGLLLADACCGRPEFDKAFRVFAKQLFPKNKLEPITPGDELYGQELNGEKLDDTNIRCRLRRPNVTKAANGRDGVGFRPMAPALEGIKVDGRWAVIYSRYDIGCALENRTSTDCIGYDHKSALKLGKAAILYALKR